MAIKYFVIKRHIIPFATKRTLSKCTDRWYNYARMHTTIIRRGWKFMLSGQRNETLQCIVTCNVFTTDYGADSSPICQPHKQHKAANKCTRDETWGPMENWQTLRREFNNPCFNEESWDFEKCFRTTFLTLLSYGHHLALHFSHHASYGVLKRFGRTKFPRGVFW